MSEMLLLHLSPARTTGGWLYLWPATTAYTINFHGWAGETQYENVFHAVLVHTTMHNTYLVKVITIINSQQLLKRGSFKMNQNKLILITQKVNTFTMNKWLEPLDSHIFPISQSIRFNKIINLKSLILRIFLIFSLWTAESTVKSPVSSLKQNHEYHRRDDDEALTWHCSLQ